MELEFERDALRYYDRLAEVTLCQEETLESIVPDACPDILRIVDVWGQAELGSRQSREGCAMASGTVRAVILYQPEDGEGLRRMEVSLPFTCQAEVKGLTERGMVQAGPRLRSAEARALNPRKVLLRVDLAVDIRAFQPTEHFVCSGAIMDEERGICQKKIQEETDITTAVEEKNFTFTERIRVGNGQSGIPQVMAVRGQPVCSESKRIGNKLIFKGSVELNLLLQDSQGMLAGSYESMPFSQVIELPEEDEDGECQVSVELLQMRWDPVNLEDGEIEITMELLAQVLLHCRRSLTMLQDIYSTVSHMQVETKPQVFWRLVEQSVRPQAVRELLETEGLVRSIVDSRLTLGRLEHTKEDNQLVFKVEAWIAVLYLDESQQVQSVRKMVPVTCRVDCPQEVWCSCVCLCPGEVFAAPGAGGIELRFGVEFHCRIRLPKTVICVEDAKLGPARGGAEGRIPSVVLRLAAPGEGIWEIAKAYGTTQEQIMLANELENDMLPAGKMLLIPRVR